MTKLKKLLSWAYLILAFFLALIFLVDMSVIAIPFLALTLLLVPKIRNRALDIPIAKVLAGKPVIIYAASFAFFVLWAETRPEGQRPVAVENKIQNEVSSDVDDESATADLQTTRKLEKTNTRDSLDTVRVISGQLETALHCAAGQAKSMQVYMFPHEGQLNIKVPRMIGGSEGRPADWNTRWSTGNHFETVDALTLLVPFANGTPIPEKIMEASWLKEPNYYFLRSVTFIDSYYDHDETPFYNLYRDGTKLEFSACNDRGDICLEWGSDSVTYGTGGDDNFYDCKPIPENPDMSHLEYLRTLFQPYTDSQRKILDKLLADKAALEAEQKF